MQCKLKILFKDLDIKGDASDVLSAVPLLRHFLETVIVPRLNHGLGREIDSFKALHSAMMCLDFIKASTDYSPATLDRLQALLVEHNCLFKRAYGLDEIKPKHHYSLHIPGQIARDQKYVDCFAAERKQKEAKIWIELLSDYTLEDYELRVVMKGLQAMLTGGLQADDGRRRNQILRHKGNLYAVVSTADNMQTLKVAQLRHSKQLYEHAVEYVKTRERLTLKADEPLIASFCRFLIRARP